MKVGELIERLKTMPVEDEVVLSDNDRPVANLWADDSSPLVWLST